MPRDENALDYFASLPRKKVPEMAYLGQKNPIPKALL
jgi:hypothetical protein